MCAAPNSPTITSMKSNENSSKPSTKPVPKWMKMKLQNKSSADKTAKPIAPKSSSSAQKPAQQGTREEKRKRWAKKAKPVAKPIVKRGPEKEYLCVCHSEPARKPQAGLKESVKDPESGKVKDKPKGLGKWRCATTGKITKVTPRKPQPIVEVTIATA